MSGLYRLINPVVKTLLRSRLHKLMSHNTLVLSYRGRRSGRQFALPISYARGSAVCRSSHQNDALFAFTARQGRWWRNFEKRGEAAVLVVGEEMPVSVTVSTEPGEELQRRLAAFLQAVPRDAKPAGVRMRNGLPLPEDLAAAADKLVSLQFDIR